MSSKVRPQPEWTPVLLVAGAAVLGFAPSLFEFSQRLWGADHYSFFPLFLAAIGFICFRRWQEDGPFSQSYSLTTALKWVFPALLLGTAIWLRRPWIAGVAAVFAARAFAYLVGGREYFRSIRLAWLVLWLCVPLPFNMDLALIASLQQFASRQGSAILDMFGYRHLLTGVLLNFPGRAFEVEEACSGIHSLYASLAAVGVYSVVLKRRIVRTVTLLVAAVFWVLVMNVARIVLVVVAEVDYGFPLGEGLPHELAGYVIFSLAVLAVMSTDRFLMFILPERSGFSDRPVNRKQSWFSRLESTRLPKNTLVGAVSVVFVLMFGMKMIRPAAASIQRNVAGMRLELDESVLPTELGDWTMKSFEIIEREPGNINGEVSYSWVFEKQGLESTIAVDGPFTTWHDLGHCYAGVGWRLIESNDFVLGEIEKVLASELRMEDTAGQYGHVVYAVFEADGRNVRPPPLRVGATGGAQMQGGLESLFVPRDSEVAGVGFCIQGFCKVPLELSNTEVQQHKRLLSDVISVLRTNLSAVPASPEREMAE